MTRERWQQVCDLLEEALELAPQQRPALLDRACDADPSLRQEVEVLLASSDRVRSSFLQRPPLVEQMSQTESATKDVLTPGAKLGPYLIQSLIGTGGMGEVYRARDTKLNREVAIKVLPEFWSRDPERLHRFELEAQAAAALNHPNIISIHHVGQYDGSPYIVTELLHGESLRERLRPGSIPLRKAIEYAVQIANGLAAAHEKGIVHRDLKPENLFVTKDGRVKILDFGLAKLTQPQVGSEHSSPTAGGETEPGAVMGTVGYMSPEQVRGQPTDHRTDIFSFGAILYEMLAGKRAFQKPTSPETMTAILNEDPPSISQITPSTPPGVQRVVHRCLEKSLEQRFHSASDLAFALEGLSNLSSGTPTTTATNSIALEHRRYLKIILSGVAGLVILGTGYLYFRQPPKPSEKDTTVHLGSVVDVHSLFPGGFTPEVNLFEAGWGPTPERTDRQYTSVFDGSLTRFVNWELHLKFPRSEQTLAFGVKAVYTKNAHPRGDRDQSRNLQIAVQNQTCQIEAGASESWCTYGWGGKNPGSWDPGDYKVELYIGTTKIAEKLFVVT